MNLEYLEGSHAGLVRQNIQTENIHWYSLDLKGNLKSHISQLGSKFDWKLDTLYQLDFSGGYNNAQLLPLFSVFFRGFSQIFRKVTLLIYFDCWKVKRITMFDFNSEQSLTPTEFILSRVLSVFAAHFWKNRDLPCLYLPRFPPNSEFKMILRERHASYARGKYDSVRDS